MLVALSALLISLGSWVAAQAEPTCTRWTDCRQLALDAAAREDFETFHSLAWRAVQYGQPNDADLMFMLARAQALSGRPDDALVMLGRLADRGSVHPEVEQLDDFSRVRDMAGWPTLLEKMHRLASAPVPATPMPIAPSPPPAAHAAPPASHPPAAPVSKLPTASSSTAVPLAGTILIPPALAAAVALAYDRVSERLILADDSSGTLKVVSALTGTATDLVSSGWGGGHHTNALVIDSQRGDLWVVGDRIGNGLESVVHRLQLISGRLLYSVAPDEGSGAARFVAVALSADSVFVLDAEGRRIFELGRGAKTLRVRVAVPADGLTGLTLRGDTVAYVAHAGGILRIDLATKQIESVGAATGIALDGIEWIGYFENSLLAVQRRPDGAMAAVRLRLDRPGRTATAVDAFGAAAARGAAVLGDMFFFLSVSPEGTAVARVNLRSGPQASAKVPPGKRR